MQQTARTHFICSLLPDLMREASVQQFASDDTMLQHLKMCLQFSKHHKPKPSSSANTLEQTVGPSTTKEEANLEKLVNELSGQPQA